MSDSNETTDEYGPIDEPYEFADRLVDLPWFSGDSEEWFYRGLILIGAALLFIPFLGSFGLWDPWETHYGEVARQILERNDWISTWWGSHWETADGGTEGSYFYSKPILLMWLMAFGMKVFGFSEFGIRLGVATIGILGVVSVYWMGRYVFSRKVGYLMAGILGTSPFWFFLSRQSQTDMPYVGLMTVGIAFYLVGLYGENRNKSADIFGYILTLVWFGLVAIPQISLVLVGLSRWRGRDSHAFMNWMSNPLEQGISYGAILLFSGVVFVLFAIWRSQEKTQFESNWLVRNASMAFPIAGVLGMLFCLVPFTSSQFFEPPYLIFWVTGGTLLCSVVGFIGLTTPSNANLKLASSVGLPAGGLVVASMMDGGPAGVDYLAILSVMLVTTTVTSVGISELSDRFGVLKNRSDQFAWMALGHVWLPYFVLLLVILILSPFDPVDLRGWFYWGPTQASLYASLTGVVFYWLIRFLVVQRRRIYLLMFYLFIGLSTLSKGLLGFLLPGAVLFLYFLITRDWKRLAQVELPLGLTVFSATTVPWYAAMLIRHPHGFWDRFFVHDHFKRFMSGVHQIDTGSFEHFIRWLGYGLFPWSAFSFAVLFYFFSGNRLDLKSRKSRAVLLILLWAVVVFTLFTLSSTKFHHYIFPGVPPLALLTAIVLGDALEREMPVGWPLYLVAPGIMVIIGWDIIADPQVLKNLFTYRYEREWDAETWNPAFRRTLFFIMIPAVIGSIYFLAKNKLVRWYSLGAIFVSSVAMTIFCLNVYMPTISSTWSQKGLWDAYFEDCTRVEGPPGALSFKQFCKEPVISYHITWRGETFYTQNQIIPIHSDEDFEKFLNETQDTGFYGLMQRHTYEGDFQTELPERFKNKSCIVHEKNIKFILVKTPCKKERRQKED